MPVALLEAGSGTSTGAVDYTNTDMGGATPKGVLIVTTHATVDGTRRDQAVFGLTFFDGTNVRSVGVQAEHNQASTDNDREGSSTFQKLNAGGHSLDFDASLAFITNGVRATYSPAPGADYRLKFIFFYGSDVSVAVGSDNPNVTQNSTITLTPGFASKLLFTASVARNFDASGTNQFRLGIGVGESGGEDRAVFLAELNALPTSGPTSRVLESRCGGEDYADWRIEATAWGATTITITTRDSAGDTDEDFMWMAIDPGDVGVWVGTLSTPTATGEWSIADPAFTPEAFGFLTSMANQLETIETGSDNGHIGMGACTVNDEWAAGVNIRDNQATTDTSSKANGKICDFDEHDGTDGIIGTLTEFDADGPDIELTAVNTGSLRYFIGWAIEEGVTAVVQDVIMGGIIPSPR